MKSGFDINELLEEAKSRWLKPAEVFFILENYEEHQISSGPLLRPPSGSLLLFNKRVHRFFRKDGHSWRKKKDGKTIGEAHERLKVGNVEALNCYYAHGEHNPNFQRRSYWMLNPRYDPIVLVHYREVNEVKHNSGPSSNLSTSCSVFNSSDCPLSVHHTIDGELNPEQHRCSFSPGDIDEVDSSLFVQNNEMNHFGTFDKSQDLVPSSVPDINGALQKLRAQLSLDDENVTQLYLPEDVNCKENDGYNLDFTFERETGLHCHNYESRNYISESRESISWEEMLNGVDSHQYPNIMIDRHDASIPSTIDISTTDTRSNPSVMSLQHDRLQAPVSGKVSFNPSEFTEYYGRRDREYDDQQFQVSESDFHQKLSAVKEILLGNDNVDTSVPIATRTSQESQLQLHGYIGNSSSSLKNDETHNYAGSIGATIDDLHLTISQGHIFHIREISPEWAYHDEDTKVIIIGHFVSNPSWMTWKCMFDNIEVPLEMIQEGVLSCQAPKGHPGKVNIYIASGNGRPCSEVREFEYRVKQDKYALHCNLTEPNANANKDESLLLVKLSRMLICEYDSERVQNDESENVSLKALKVDDNVWENIIEELSHGIGTLSETMDWLLQAFLKDKLHQWLMLRHKDAKDADCFLCHKEKGIIHIIAALGYEWALSSILNSGVGVNFRDPNGWTALHWAARFGREKMVASLLAAGAFPGAVTDPNTKDPFGKTAASIASENNHKGLAGYLSELSLTSHLSSLTIKTSTNFNFSANAEAERNVEESVSQMSRQTSIRTFEDQLSLDDSLEAVRNATQAAICIQSAFRAHSFRKRQETSTMGYDEYGMTPDDIQSLSSISKIHRILRGNRDRKLDNAALSIQKKYRGWKSRRDFLTLRQNVVKIQAHVRGHQVRRKYREFIWTAGILEKAVLRWRRRGVGLRGYKAEPDPSEESDDDDILKVFRKVKVDASIDESLERVLSMVGSSDARQQYRRMLESYRKAKVKVCETPPSSQDSNFMESIDDDMYLL